MKSRGSQFFCFLFCFQVVRQTLTLDSIDTSKNRTLLILYTYYPVFSCLNFLISWILMNRRYILWRINLNIDEFYIGVLRNLLHGTLCSQDQIYTRYKMVAKEHLELELFNQIRSRKFYTIIKESNLLANDFKCDCRQRTIIVKVS